MGIAQQTASSARYVQITLEGESIMASKKSKSRKEVLADELEQHFANYTKLFVVGVDNVTSNQLHEIRKSMRGEAVIYCGKNTQIRRVLRKLEEQGMEQLERSVRSASSTLLSSSPTETWRLCASRLCRIRCLLLPRLVPSRKSTSLFPLVLPLWSRP